MQPLEWRCTISLFSGALRTGIDSLFDFFDSLRFPRHEGAFLLSYRLPVVGERFECQPSGLSGEAGNEMSESTETSGNPSGAAAPIEVAESCRRQATEGLPVNKLNSALRIPNYAFRIA